MQQYLTLPLVDHNFQPSSSYPLVDYTSQPSSACPPVDYTSQPSSSHSPIGAPHSPPEQTEDIMDEFEHEDEYDTAPYDYNGGPDVDDEEDTDGDDDDVNPAAPINIYEDPIVSFLAQIDIDGAKAPNYAEMEEEAKNMNDDQEFSVGMLYNDKRSFRRAAKIYSVRAHHTFFVLHSSKKYEEYRCVQYKKGLCRWKFRVCYRKKEKHWELTKYNGPHTCVSAFLSQDHPKLDSDVISAYIVSMVTENPEVSIRDVIEQVHSIFGYTVSYKKAWNGKN